MSDLAALFAADPHNHTDKDIDKIIEAMREARKNFQAGNMTAGKTKPKTAKEKQASEAAGQLSLKDIGL